MSVLSVVLCCVVLILKGRVGVRPGESMFSCHWVQCQCSVLCCVVLILKGRVGVRVKVCSVVVTGCCVVLC